MIRPFSTENQWGINETVLVLFFKITAFFHCILQINIESINWSMGENKYASRRLYSALCVSCCCPGQTPTGMCPRHNAVANVHIYLHLTFILPTCQQSQHNPLQNNDYKWESRMCFKSHRRHRIQGIQTWQTGSFIFTHYMSLECTIYIKNKKIKNKILGGCTHAYK